jgi:hypothetical protein
MIDADALLRELTAKPMVSGAAKAAAMDLVRAAPTIGGWISVKDRMPAETHSIFWRLIGSKQWTNAMWREQSGKVLVTVSFKDGTRFVTTGETHDGVWNTTISRTLEHEVTHWMPLPEPPKEEE